MRIVIYGDAHWCQYSSIIRKNGDKYSVRLHNLIDSINFVERLAEDNRCEAVVNLGDFFDRAELNAEEITALHEVNWYKGATHFNIIGNHEMGRNDLSTSSCDLFNLVDNSLVIEDECIFDVGNCELAFLPYCLEDNRKEISLPARNKKRILFSHNDIKGIQMGKFISTSGYSIEELESHCDICFNGHLHNGEKVSSKIIDVGNLTGQNFNEDAFKYSHGAYIIDTDTLEYKFYENPFSFNFYKLDFTNNNYDVELKSNAICSIKCFSRDADFIKNWICGRNIIESRIVTQPELTQEINSITDNETFSVDHIQKFREYILNNFEKSDILLQELEEVSK